MIHLIHGFRELHPIGDPRISTALKNRLLQRGDAVTVHDYGYLDLVGVKCNRNLARLIRPSVKRGDTLVGFSNGCAIIAHLQTMKSIACPKIVLIQPALAQKWTPNKHCASIDVYYNSGDKATVAGKWWRRLINVLPWRWQARHMWGEMGHDGYTGKDLRFTQYDTENTPGMPRLSGHGTWQHAKSTIWQDFIAARI